MSSRGSMEVRQAVHFVGVWNPSYAADAMDAHLQLLLRAAGEYRGRSRDQDDVYVWWGKVRSPNRQQPLPHLVEILAIDDSIEREAGQGLPGEVHLYLTDYRSLYVGHVGGITAQDQRDDAEHVPSYYRDKNLPCDCWFQLWDIRRLVADDTVGVIEELKQLRNVRYHDRPVSIYGGMVELPLIVRRDDDARYFDPELSDSLLGGLHWCEFDAQRSGIGAMERELRENLFGDRAWAGLDPAARTFIASAEAMFRLHRPDAAFDFTGVVVDLAKAFEVQTNAVLRRAMARASEAVRSVNIDGASIDLARGRALTLGELARVIGEQRGVNEFLRQRLENGGWFAASLPPILREMAELRNPAAHERCVERREVAELRDRCVGVGQSGTLVELGKVALR
jgi:hypothetical protein